MDKVLLNWLPPSSENMPSPAHSVLKYYLERNGYEVHVEYWNLKLCSTLESFLNLGKRIYEVEYNKLLPFYGYLGIEYNDNDLLRRLTEYVLALKPQLHIKGDEYILNEFHKFHEYFNNYIDTFIDDFIRPQDYILIGFSSLFYQWIIATIISKRIKQRISDINILVGGFGTRKEAQAFQKNFSWIDFVSWGEGESSIKSLCDALSPSHNIDYGFIPNTIGSNLAMDNPPQPEYVDLDTICLNYSDYFKQRTQFIKEIGDTVLPVEGGRGCHWRRCRFCFLNSGYKSRFKTPENIIQEIRKYIHEYNVRKFLFLDNDLIGGDILRFNKILDGLIAIRNDYNDFTVQSAEIITKGVTYENIVRMAAANFEAVQIGYESPSSHILKKIDKKNTFASNLFFIKWAVLLGIKINGANIIRNLPEETSSDIEEAIANLRYLRFFLKEGVFTHSRSDLAICDASRYFKVLTEKGVISQWNHSSNYDFLPTFFIKEEDRYSLLLDWTKVHHNSKWDLFAKLEKHYIENDYTYKLLSIGSQVLYREYFNGLLIKELEFDSNDDYWIILCLCNKQIQTIQSISEELTLSKDKISLIVQELSEEHLIYIDSENSEIVTIINTDIINFYE